MCVCVKERDAVCVAKALLVTVLNDRIEMCLVNVVAMKSLRKLNLNSTYLSALTFEGLKVDIQTCAT